MGWRKAGWGGRQQVTIVRAVHLGDGGHWPPGHLATWPLNKRCKRCSSLWAVIVGGGGLDVLLMVNIFCSGFSLRIQESLSPTAPN
jgi:hypothetical protein